MLAPARSSTAADLLRLVAVWLAVILALQGWHAARAGAQGPLHRHAGVVQGQGQGQGHDHAAARHFHFAAQQAGVEVPEHDWDAVAFALTAALALMALGHPGRLAAQAARHVWRAQGAWRPRSVVQSPPTPPPRRG